MDAESVRMNLKRIVIFLVTAFVITYGIEIFLIAPLVGSSDINEAIMAQSLTASVMFVPAIAVIITRLITKEGFMGKELYLSLNLKKNLKYYGLVWFGFAALILIGAVLYFLVFPEQFDKDMGFAAALFNANPQAESPMNAEGIRKIMMVQIVMGVFLSPLLNFVNCFGEEWGWRGYLLPKLLERFSAVKSILISGVIWGLWHAPITALGHNYGVGYPGFPFTGILAMCVFCTVIGTILSYVTIKTRSCIPAILGHGMLNGLSGIGIYFTSLENPYNVFLGPSPTGLIGGTGFILLAIGLLWRLYQEEKAVKA